MDPESPSKPLRITLGVVDRFYAGETTPEETAELQARLDKNPALAGLFDDARIYNGTTGALDESSAGPSWEAMHARILQSRQSVPGVAKNRFEPSQARRRFRWSAFASACVAIIAMVIGTRFWNTRHAAPSAAIHTYTTRAAEYTAVSFADSSRAILGPLTTLKAVETSNGVIVSLSGEAHFAVAPHTSAAFVVQTRNTNVRVLGTSFSVRQYGSESQSRVFVEAGKVDVRRTHSKTLAYLTAGMLAQVADSGISVLRKTKTGIATDWTSGALLFDGVTLREVLAELSKLYGTDVQVADSTLARRSMLIELSVKDQPLYRVLEVIGIAVNARSQRTGQGFLLVPGRPAARNAIPKMPYQQENAYGR